MAMPSAEVAPYSSPFILDLDMSHEVGDPDFEFFDTDTPFATSSGVGGLIEEGFGVDSPRYSSTIPNGAPAAQKQPSHNNTFQSPRPQTLSAPSSASPAGSFQDSSSDSSRYKRKSSSSSSHSAVTGGDKSMMDADMSDWNAQRTPLGGNGLTARDYDGTMNPSSMENAFGFSDQAMENDFDFDSAASSPFGTGAVKMESPEMPTIRYDTPRRASSKMRMRAGHHNKINSQHSITQSMHGLTTSGSREASPLSAMVTSQDSSPSAFFNNSPSPTGGVDFISGPMLSGVSQTSPWPTFDFNAANMNMQSGLTPQPFMNHLQPSLSSSLPLIDSALRPILTIHPTPLKSRVETQIPIKLTLFPMPAGATKLHLPTHTISKPKLLAKPTPEKSPDMLELHTMLVCTSAMQNPEFRQRAFARAASATLPEEPQAEESPAEGVADEDDENKPLNGGEVKICAGCVTRERKRAARKKVKKVEEEESWHKDESRRVIVFNTHEVKEWQPPSGQLPSDATGDRVEPMVPEGAMQVDAPMRIACYCRHQNEKLGFQVIFTIKDWNDRVVAQEITSSIMITDDHKTHNLPPLSTQTSLGADSLFYNSNNNLLGPEPNFDIPMAPFRSSHSSSDLQSLQRSYAMGYIPPIGNPPASHPNQVVSASVTPRSGSRQGSPTGTSAPNKKRKASGSGKVPTGLAMTRLETRPPGAGPGVVSGTASGTTSTAPSPYTPSVPNFHIPPEPALVPTAQNMQSIPAAYNTGPPTPNSNDQTFFSAVNRSHSMENLSMHQLYSAPASAHPSRAPSPNGIRNNVQAYQQQQAQIAQAVANGLYGMPLALNPHRPPTIHKMIPSEGPKAGGVEVTCLGSGFCQGLEVMFGDNKATTTTFWGETSLVCLLPPSAVAGPVAVTFKHQHQQQMQPYPTPPILKQQILFTYVDDDESQLIKTALMVLGHKMGGKIEDVKDLARRIIGDNSSSWGSSGHSGSGGSYTQQGSGFNGLALDLDVEATLLRCLDLIDLDDSPNAPRLNLRKRGGQTMLHLACALGYHRLAAGLLARGANPEPRDKGGFTPMHFAAMHNHAQIVRRLILSGADPSMRSLQGFTPADLSTSEEVLRATRKIEHHTRTRSGGSMRSKTSSATSLRSLWEPARAVQLTRPLTPADESSEEDITSDEDADDDEEDASEDIWMRSRRPSTQSAVLDLAGPVQAAHIELPAIIEDTMAGARLPSAAMAAFRDQVSAQFQHLQQSMHLNLPTLAQMPALPMMPTLPDYQAYLPTTAPMVRRISSLVPTMSTARGGPAADSRWWDMFSGSASAAPPAYDEIFPQDDTELKRSSATQAAADAAADSKCVSLFDTVTASSSTGDVKVALDAVSTSDAAHVEQEMALPSAINAEKVKRLRSDRNLFFIWIPLLLVIMLAMLYNRVPQIWVGASKMLGALPIRNDGRVVEVN